MESLLPIIDAARPTGVVQPFVSRAEETVGGLRREKLTQLQINLGKLCNQTCTHCHVEAGPTKKRENMDARTADRILDLAGRASGIQTVDLTGGAPEMNPNFRRMVQFFRQRDIQVIDRCNLTILSEDGYQGTADFLAENTVHVIASLPCYLEDNVDRQRGNGVFDRSVSGLLQLNELGYGRDPALKLDLVFNPTGPSLPPDQATLQQAYTQQLRDRFGIVFNELLCITNVPIKRYARFLQKNGQLEDYMRLLADHYNADAAEQVMCRSLVSIGWDGVIFDCDFNQMLEMPIGGGPTRTVWDVENLDDLLGNIAVCDHCYACTAGAGSSCSGAIT
ncbi:MAG: arsenosugar biosynthesis radical SAM (seleno)protein ArsS [Planctomycetota bacterium]